MTTFATNQQVVEAGSLGTGTFDPRHAELGNGSKVPVPNDPLALYCDDFVTDDEIFRFSEKVVEFLKRYKESL